MKPSDTSKKFSLIFLMGMLIFLLSGCIGGDGDSQIREYPIDSNVSTTLETTIAFDTTVSGLSKNELSQVSQYSQYGYGIWTEGHGLASDQRDDSAPSGIMPAGYTRPELPPKVKLLQFFTISDIHITDKESPAQLIYLQQVYYPVALPGLGNYPWAFVTSLYSPNMLYTTHVLDAVVQTVNALHQQNPFDFGISLGDTCNSTQYNELRWYIDVLDGKIITPSSGAHAGADTIDYQKPYKAAGLDKTIPWYQTLGNHDHFWMGSFPVSIFLRESCISDTVIAAGDVLLNGSNLNSPDYYMGVIDGATPNGDIIGAGPVINFSSAPQVVADPDRFSLLRSEWIDEFFITSSNPVGHGFNLVDPDAAEGFACYSFVPNSDIPLKVIVLDDTQSEDDGDINIHGHGFLDQARYDWLKKELADGDAADQLMIIAAHIPIGVETEGGQMSWWSDAQNAVTLTDLIAELHSHPNLLMWIAGHRHLNTVKAFITNDPDAPENGFWQVETSSLLNFPQQFRTFEIYLNSDYTISIVTTNVDPAVKDGTPAAKSRAYAVATQQIVKENLTRTFQNADPALPPDTDDPSIKLMPLPYSYNATLFKQLSPAMKAKMQALFP